MTAGEVERSTWQGRRAQDDLVAAIIRAAPRAAALYTPPRPRRDPARRCPSERDPAVAGATAVD
jgi:hypothetical protein